jgi:chromosomal replication initiator protein
VLAVNTNAWELIKQRLSARLSRESYQNWVANTVLREDRNGALRIAVPNEAAKAWLEQEYSALVQEAIRELQLKIRRIDYELLPVSERRPPGVEPREAAAIDFQSQNNSFHPSLTFDTFVVGSSNRFAQAAAWAVAEGPGTAYNPLVICGRAGVGKTHLLKAIGRHISEHRPELKVIYTSSERFMNEMIHCITTQRMSQFHRHYRSADVLLVDDIHVLAGKERTQEEFFHTFNELHDRHKQIVMSSDTPPRDIPGLVERLRSRLESGLIADLQPPDLETKLAILDRKAQAEGITLPEDVRIFVATRVRSNVRELEGAVAKLVLYSSVCGKPITLAMAEHCLRHLNPPQERKISIETIQRAVSEHFGLTPSHLKQRSNAHAISYPRQIAMYLCRELTQASLPAIGKAFGGKHHTTVLHAIQKIERLREKDQDLNRLVQRLIDSIH